jgi:hypothetical protein
MKKTATLLATLLTLSLGSAGYVASAQAMDMKKDDKMMMMHKKKMMKKKHMMKKMDHMKKM